MDLKEYRDKVAFAERKLQQLIGQKVVLKSQYDANCKTIKESEKKNSVFLKTSALLQQVSNKTREQSITKIEEIVTQAIQEVYGDKDIKFKIIFENKRNAVAVEFKLWDEKLQNHVNLIRAEAGGIKNIISTILRLVVIDLYHPRITGPVVLDEIGVHISQEYQERFGKFLEQYSFLTGRQIILVSHIDKVKKHANRTIRLKRINTDSEIDDKEA